MPSGQIGHRQFNLSSFQTFSRQKIYACHNSNKPTTQFIIVIYTFIAHPTNYNAIHHISTIKNLHLEQHQAILLCSTTKTIVKTQNTLKMLTVFFLLSLFAYIYRENSKLFCYSESPELHSELSLISFSSLSTSSSFKKLT